MKPIFVLLFIAIISSADSQLKPPCTNFNCSTLQCATSSSGCTYGTTAGPCDCCNICAKGLGESCGTLLGDCGKNMKCCSPLSYVPIPVNILIVGTCYKTSATCPRPTTPAN